MVYAHKTESTEHLCHTSRGFDFQSHHKNWDGFHNLIWVPITPYQYIIYNRIAMESPEVPTLVAALQLNLGHY